VILCIKRLILHLARDLQVLNLGWNAIKFKGVRVLARALEGGACGAITTLGLQANHLGDDSMQVLADAFLAADDNLKLLANVNLNLNEMTDRGMTFLANALFHTSTLVRLQVLSVEHNRMSEAGAKHVLSAISVRDLPKPAKVPKRKNERSKKREQRRRRGKNATNKDKANNNNNNSSNSSSSSSSNSNSGKMRFRIRGNRISAAGKSRLMQRFAGIVAL
jgi:Ran GTPase-activating protein (RanGAP) involved in mRNA processing and transport